MRQPRDARRCTGRRLAPLRAAAVVALAAAALGCSDLSGVPQDLPCTGGPDGSPPAASYLLLRQDVLTNADYWEPEPRILAAGLGFTDIIGVPGLASDDLATQRLAVLDAGGAWNVVVTSQPTVPLRAYTSAASPQGVANTYGWPVQFCDGLPIELSWPVRPSTVDGSDFRVFLNDGAVVTPLVASIHPNLEFDERSTVVIFGEFGNRLAPHEPGAPPPFSAQMPNDGVALFGPAAAYRLRILTTGGFSPDGVRSVLPTEFARYFRLIAVDAAGREHVIEEPGRSYAIDGGTLTVLGLADLGVAQSTYDDAYVEDHDNQIDIVLAGDEVAVRTIRLVEIPAGDGYSLFYNPGGPGNDPHPGTIYSQPGSPTRQPVTLALDDPMTVDWPPPPVL